MVEMVGTTYYGTIKLPKVHELSSSYAFKRALEQRHLNRLFAGKSLVPLAGVWGYSRREIEPIDKAFRLKRRLRSLVR